MNLSQCNNVADLRVLAKKKLPEPVFHYMDGGADDELTLDRNTRAFDDYELMPTQLSDVSQVRTESTLFGKTLSHPIMLSPTGGSKLFHKDGELGVARAARRHGLLYSLSTLGTTTIEDVAAETDSPTLYQLYVFKDRALTEEFIDRCRDSGYTALALTVDTPVAGNRERDFIYGFSAPPRSRLRQIASFLRHPLWLKRALIDKEIEMVNITRSTTFGQSIDTEIREFIANDLERSLTWKDVEWIASRWDGPLVVKGVQSVEDCRRSAESGASAVMLSNHGGRQLESAPAPMDCVADVADALGDRLEIICDGGIRRGSHIVKALAAGATACSIGRGYLFGLAAGGEAGVDRALTLLLSEFERTLALCGCNDVAKLQQKYLHRRKFLT
ncbi:MAG: alpha-hydroxy acid oxidase [Pseudomonadota bacterium]